MKFGKILLATFFFIITMSTAFADEKTVSMVIFTDGTTTPIGTILLKDTPYGMEIIPRLVSLKPGVHGFHLHQNPSCANKGEAAGPHFDPQATNHHNGPYVESGHLGDLPAMTVNSDNSVNLPLLAPRLKVQDVTNHALIVHLDGDNYSDNPPLGGGGARVACGTT